MKALYVQRLLLLLLLAAAVLLAAILIDRVHVLPVTIALVAALVLSVSSFLVLLLDTASVPFRIRGESSFGRLLSCALSPTYSAATRCLSLAGVPASRIHRFFVRMNNRAVRKQSELSKKTKVTVLLPFCLQGRHCSVELSRDASNCRVCGRCQMGELLEIAKEAGVCLRIASRSELAPGIVRETATDLAIAIACPEKLAKGVIWTYYCPCFCIEASGDGQSCLEPVVDLSTVKEAVGFFRVAEAR